MKQNGKFTIALPKGRILDVVLPILSKIGIEPEETFFDNKDRKLRFNTNISYIDIRGTAADAPYYWFFVGCMWIEAWS